MKWFKQKKTNEAVSPVSKTPWQLEQEKNGTQTIAAPQKKSTGKRSLVWYLLFANGIVIAFWSILFLSPLVKPQSIVVVGANQLTIEELQSITPISNKNTIISVMMIKDKISAYMQEKNKKIHQVDLSVMNINHLVMTIQENPTVAYYDSDNKTMELLADGQTIENSDAFNVRSFPKIDTMAQEEYKELAQQLAKLTPSVLDEIQSIKKTGNKHQSAITIIMRDSNIVEALLTDFGDKLNYYPSIKKEIGSKRGTINMEVGIYFTPKS